MYHWCHDVRRDTASGPLGRRLTTELEDSLVVARAGTGTGAGRYNRHPPAHHHHGTTSWAPLHHPWLETSFHHPGGGEVAGGGAGEQVHWSGDQDVLWAPAPALVLSRGGSCKDDDFIQDLKNTVCKVQIWIKVWSKRPKIWHSGVLRVPRNKLKNTTDSWNQLPELSLTLLRGGDGEGRGWKMW